MNPQSSKLLRCLNLELKKLNESFLFEAALRNRTGNIRDSKRRALADSTPLD